MTQDAPLLPSGSTSVLSAEQLHDWLRLLLAPGIGAVSLRALADRYGDADCILQAIRAGMTGASGRARKAIERSHERTRDNCLEWLAAGSNRHILAWSDPRYPQQLREISDPPPLLFIEGQPDCLQRPQLAIVGSRKATPAGLEITRRFAHALSQHGVTISSGLALGIDASAHLGALEANGDTIAVLGNGLDKIYPARHQSLAEDISATGALVSEFVPGTPPLADNFPRRNRIISGLSLGVLVVEAAVRSGSLITARLAGEQGREVFAIPGSIHNPQARGCHKLLREGAVLVEEIDDILRELPPGETSSLATTVQKLDIEPENTGCDAEQRHLLEQMGFDPVDIDTLVERCALTAERVSSMLLLLELQGNVAAVGGGRFQRCGK